MKPKMGKRERHEWVKRAVRRYCRGATCRKIHSNWYVIETRGNKSYFGWWATLEWAAGRTAREAWKRALSRWLGETLMRNSEFRARLSAALLQESGEAKTCYVGFADAQSIDDPMFSKDQPVAGSINIADWVDANKKPPVE